MADITAIRQAIADTINAADGIEWYAYASTPDAPNPPCVVVPLPSVEYHQTLGGTVLLTYGLHIIVQRADPQASEDRLAQALSDSSALAAVLEASRTLGGTASMVQVTGVSSPVTFDYGDQGGYFGLRMDVEALA